MLIAGSALLINDQASNGQGPIRLPAVSASPALPEPIYWKQDLFLVPYQWNSAAEAGAAQAVWLFLSKDHGATWQKISEARPHVTSFNYRAEGEGEYWFAIRTLDKQGRAWPAGPYQPELRVIVDTTMPRINELSAAELPNSAVQIAWCASDANLDPASLRIEAQMDPAGNWQPVGAESLTAAAPGPASSVAPTDHVGQVLWQLPAGSRPLAIRATLQDLAGNPASYQTQITPIYSAPAPVGPQRSVSSPASPTTTQSSPWGWISGSDAVAQPTSTPTSQPWPASATHRAPFRLFSSGPTLPDDGITAYGSAPIVSAPQIADSGMQRDDRRIEARYAGPVVPDSDDTPVLDTRAVRESPDPTPQETRVVRGSPDPAPQAQHFSPLEPFRQASSARLPATPIVEPSIAGAPPTHSYAAPSPPVQPKQVGSRTFALEYDLDVLGSRGVTKVELWGTRDGGQTWQRFTHDDDLRSPLVVTVDEEGVYGFRIVVETAGTAADAPAPGDEPELWVAVDLHRPAIELTGLERGEGNLADHLILRWRAADDNLESRPISLFYSSRPVGPWSAIATNLEDTGEYAWRVERHVPARFYLRLEARDVAGNLAAFQTRESIEFDPLEPAGRLRDVEPVGPTASGEALRY